MRKLLAYGSYGRDGEKPFFSRYTQSNRRADFLFTRTEQVVF